MANFSIADRFCGPPETGNGGYTCGLLDAHTDFVSEVSLWKPPPLNKALQVLAAEGRVELYDGITLIASAVPGKINLKAPSPPAAAIVADATSKYIGLRKDLPFPDCFVCGVNRSEGDGMRVFTGNTGISSQIDSLQSGSTERAIYAAAWTPHPALGDKKDKVSKAYLWGALDCPGAFAIMGERALKIVLGRMTAHILRQVKVGENCTILAWSEGSEGRKLFSGTAIYDSRQELCAVAHSTWFRIP